MKRELGRRRFLAALGWGAAGLGACFLGGAGMLRSNRRLQRSLEELRSRRAVLPPVPGRLDLKGVLHVHSRLSPDSRGRPEEIVAAAQEAGLRFVMTTDHNTRRVFQEGLQGRFGDLSIFRGVEMIKDGQSLLAVDAREFIDGHRMSIEQAVREIKSQGALAFVAHPWRFRAWQADGIDGMEIYDIADAAYAQAWKAPWMGLEMLSSWDECPEEVLLGLLARPGRHLAAWDAQLRRRKLVGIAGNDAHQNVRFLGMQLDPYPLDFRFVQTHLLAVSGEDAALLDALRSGHAYACFALLGDGTGFRFLAEEEGIAGIMGDEVAYRPGLRLALQAPLPGRIDLYRDGALLRASDAAAMSYPVERPGVYRAEVSLEIDGRRYPWIVSNPIYIV